MSKFGPYKVRKSVNTRQTSYSIGLPPEIGYPLAGRAFMVEVRENGILFTVAPTVDSVSGDVLVDPAAEHLATLFLDTP